MEMDHHPGSLPVVDLAVILQYAEASSTAAGSLPKPAQLSTQDIFDQLQAHLHADVASKATLVLSQWSATLFGSSVHPSCVPIAALLMPSHLQAWLQHMQGLMAQGPRVLHVCDAAAYASSVVAVLQLPAVQSAVGHDSLARMVQQLAGSAVFKAAAAAVNQAAAAETVGSAAASMGGVAAETVAARTGCRPALANGFSHRLLDAAADATAAIPVAAGAADLAANTNCQTGSISGTKDPTLPPPHGDNHQAGSQQAQPLAAVASAATSSERPPPTVTLSELQAHLVQQGSTAVAACAQLVPLRSLARLVKGPDGDPGSGTVAELLQLQHVTALLHYYQQQMCFTAGLAVSKGRIDDSAAAAAAELKRPAAVLYTDTLLQLLQLPLLQQQVVSAGELQKIVAAVLAARGSFAATAAAAAALIPIKPAEGTPNQQPLEGCHDQVDLTMAAAAGGVTRAEPRASARATPLTASASESHGRPNPRLTALLLAAAASKQAQSSQQADLQKHSLQPTAGALHSLQPAAQISSQPPPPSPLAAATAVAATGVVVQRSPAKRRHPLPVDVLFRGEPSLLKGRGAAAGGAGAGDSPDMFAADDTAQQQQQEQEDEQQVSQCDELQAAGLSGQQPSSDGPGPVPLIHPGAADRGAAAKTGEAAAAAASPPSPSTPMGNCQASSSAWLVVDPPAPPPVLQTSPSAATAAAATAATGPAAVGTAAAAKAVAVSPVVPAVQQGDPAAPAEPEADHTTPTATGVAAGAAAPPTTCTTAAAASTLLNAAQAAAGAAGGLLSTEALLAAQHRMALQDCQGSATTLLLTGLQAGSTQPYSDLTAAKQQQPQQQRQAPNMATPPSKAVISDHWTLPPRSTCHNGRLRRASSAEPPLSRETQHLLQQRLQKQQQRLRLLTAGQTQHRADNNAPRVYVAPIRRQMLAANKMIAAADPPLVACGTCTEGGSASAFGRHKYEEHLQQLLHERLRQRELLLLQSQQQQQHAGASSTASLLPHGPSGGTSSSLKALSAAAAAAAGAAAAVTAPGAEGLPGTHPFLSPHSSSSTSTSQADRAVTPPLAYLQAAAMAARRTQTTVTTSIAALNGTLPFTTNPAPAEAIPVVPPLEPPAVTAASACPMLELAERTLQPLVKKCFCRPGVGNRWQYQTHEIRQAVNDRLSKLQQLMQLLSKLPKGHWRLTQFWADYEKLVKVGAVCSNPAGRAEAVKQVDSLLGL